MVGISWTTGWSCRVSLRFTHFFKNWRRDICESLGYEKKIKQTIFHWFWIEKMKMWWLSRQITWNIEFSLSLSVENTGESTGICFVNLGSNCETSSSLLKIGLIGGSKRLASTSSQLTNLKKGCILTAWPSYASAPNRKLTCLFISLRIKSRASGVR